MPRSQTLTFASAQQQSSDEYHLGAAPFADGRVTIHIAPTGCAISACVLQVRPVAGADYSDLIGGSSSTDWSATNNPRLRDVSSTLPSSIAAAGTAWASVDLSGFYSARIQLTSNGAGSAVVRMS